MQKSSGSKVVMIVVIIVLVLCCCLLLVLGGSYGLYKWLNLSGQSTVFVTDTPSAPVVVTRPPVDTIPTDTLSLLEQTIVPNNDPRDLACRLQGKCSIPEVVATSAPDRPVGDADKFWVTNTDTNQSFQIDATLQYVTPHVYFWVENGVDFNQKDMQDLVNTFENKIYPTDRAFFGSEWTPGIDGDVHIYILYARGIGQRVAGYFSSADEISPQAHKYSNAHEMFLFNADNSPLNDPYTYGVLAHEFQHMIHWHLDRNETSWINEGFSELAVFLNGYTIGGQDWAFLRSPDLQLTDWPNDPNATGPHYGAGFLFTDYFLNRFGEQATQALVRDPENGLESVDDVLKSIGATDPQSGQPITADDVVIDWMTANYLQDSSVADGRFAYQNYPDAPKAAATEKIDTCPQDNNYSVKQYGAEYIDITCKGNFTLNFTGSTQTGLLPESPHSGNFAFWSNKGDESDMTLTHSFDFSQVSGPLSISFWTWYDIEKDYDYIYLEVSEDGKTWQIIKTPSGTDQDPSGNSYGWGYNGTSGGGPQWIQETVDLSQYAGKQVQLRFEYVTDAAVNGEGLLLDDVSIPAINYTTDFESDDGGWDAAGFVRIQNALPQTYRLALILKGKTTSVQMIAVSQDQSASIPLDLSGDTREAILVVTGTTRFTREQASYTISVK
jgi:immune inhibitor A